MWYGENPMPNPFLMSNGDCPSGPAPRGRIVVFVASRTLTGMLVYNLFAAMNSVSVQQGTLEKK
jgi:hypothetical protein